jgi:hypothetical protein
MMWVLWVFVGCGFGHFTTISGQFIAKYIDIFHKIVVLRGLTTLNLNLI